MQDYLAIYKVWKTLAGLKTTLRRGWLVAGRTQANCESVADHIFGTAILAWLCAHQLYPNLNAEHVLALALAHEFGEALVGDIIPADGVSANDKHAQEWDAVKKVFSGLPGGQSFEQLWQEFEEGKTEEAALVKQIDKLEMAWQAGVYQQQGLQAQNFVQSAQNAITNPQLQQLLSLWNYQEQK